jgi:hypothetical protein
MVSILTAAIVVTVSGVGWGRFRSALVGHGAVVPVSVNDVSFDAHSK